MHWPLYVVVLLLLVVEWPFCIRLTEDVEVYFAVRWTGAAAAYVVGPMILPLYWLSAILGFALIVVLDTAGVIRTSGIAAESVKRYRGQPYARTSINDGEWRHFLNVSEAAVRLVAFALASAAGVPLLGGVLIGEAGAAAWQRLVPVPGRMGPARRRARVAASLGQDMPLATDLLHLVMVCYLVLANLAGGALGFVGASLSTVVLHAILKRLSDTRLESERQRGDLLAMQGELDRRQRLAAIGQTASSVLHQIGRHHGAIGMYAHLLARGATATGDDAAWRRTAGEHASRIATSVEEANRVIDELLRFGQDRALHLYPQSIAALVDECVQECEARARDRDVQLRVAITTETTIPVDKHKVKQAIGNLLDNAVDATPVAASVDVAVTADGAQVAIAVRDHGAGVAESVRERLFTPFCTTKPHGIGLGLALAKELIEAHGGSVEWHPAEPGTQFVVRLPVDLPGAMPLRRPSVA